MMKSFTKNILLAFLLIISASSCTHNNGNIGELFGLWKVTSISIDGSTDNNYSGNIFFAFQAGTFCQRLVYPETGGHDVEFASWEWQNENLLVDFSDSRYEPFAQTGMGSGKNLMVVKSLSASAMELEHTSASGKLYHYSLKKW